MVDNIIRLFESSATAFTTLGIGAISDAISCVVVEERNGIFELEMQYPITGLRYSDIKLRNIIVSKTTPHTDPQPFRIYDISKPLNGIVTISAQHLSYDLIDLPVSPFDATTDAQAFLELKAASVLPCPFTFTTFKATSGYLDIPKPTSMRSVLGGSENTILDIYGGEYEFDNYHVKLHNNRGSNRGVTLRYGKNIIDLEQEENCANVYTGVYPYWYSDNEGLVQLPEKILSAPGTYDFERILPLDLTSDFDDKPTVAQLRNRANLYISDNSIGIPRVSLTVSFVQLAQSEEYKNYSLLETVYLCDTVTVEFPELGVNATAKCVTTKYNAITNKYIEIELGDAISNLSKTIGDQNIKIKEFTDKTNSLSDMISKIPDELDQAIQDATQLITGGLGGYVAIRSSTGGDTPDEILIMNTDNISTATQVWRWNRNGLGYSSTGYNGPYSLAMTSNGQIVADFIKTGTLTAITIMGVVITGSTLISESGTYRIEIKDGKLIIRDTDLNNDGLVIGYTTISGRDHAMVSIAGDVNDTIMISSYLDDMDIGAISFRLWANDDNFTGRLVEQNLSWRGTDASNRPFGEFEIYFGSSSSSNTFVVRNGSKNAVVETEEFGDVYFSAYETSEIYFGHIGEGQVTDGECLVPIPEKLIACSNMYLPYQVVLSKYGPGDIWVDDLTADSFKVKGADIRFGYEIKTRRKGFEAYNFGIKEEEI